MLALPRIVARVWWLSSLWRYDEVGFAKVESNVDR